MDLREGHGSLSLSKSGGRIFQTSFDQIFGLVPFPYSSKTRISSNSISKRRKKGESRRWLVSIPDQVTWTWVLMLGARVLPGAKPARPLVKGVQYEELAKKVHYFNLFGSDKIAVHFT